ncbi:MAG: YcxB family protein [Oscillospiraceae bacterium]|nr:YcxB family protein [Oscillospiraceae bacterium]
MYPIVYQFKSTMDDFREMTFFSTFSFRKGQNFAILIAWIAGTAAFLLDLTNVIELTQTIHLCALMVAVTMPMLFVSYLVRVRRFKINGAAYRKKTHTVLLNQDALQYRESGNNHTGTDRWDDLAYAFETSHLFLIFRTPNNAVLLPKRCVTEKQIEETRVCLKENLGVRFKIRCRVKSKGWKRKQNSSTTI